MPTDFLQLLKDHGVDSSTEDKNVGRGWIGINCPFCPDPSYHGGFNLANNFYNCHRCGWHPIIDVVAELLRVDVREAKKILQQYSTEDTLIEPRAKQAKRVTKVPWPISTGILNDQHISYLESRNFDPYKLQREWGLIGTGSLGPYKFRIIAPITFNSLVVSYQGRDITGRARLKYKACEKKDEIIDHKHTLYGLDQARGDYAIILEGITDVWRMGPGSVATFGTEYTRQQVEVLCGRYKKAFILYDPNELQANRQAHKLGKALDVGGVDSYIINIETIGDPAELSPTDALELKRDLIGY